MGLLYGWATPEYVLWHMTIGQVFMLHNRGVELKYPSQNNGIDADAVAEAQAEFAEMRERWPELYGDIDGDPR